MEYVSKERKQKMELGSKIEEEVWKEQFKRLA